ncbi:hypothetical protein [Paraburkholderia silvatlantica]|uniref:Secreted protein n=1 Tax=Paraburkholderia silvatlantica TaxID=321895 RepID=A0A2U1A8E2_9BURK|nr:hypothetical protein [Paraburkholderia silvatlantica]MBB2929039.1 hypothetical protein [Paraburkholderia silvatlantica]PVY29134.1 hypothetical protein C7411_11553 [Paraburkholderia silvatlantica]PXW36609.1 hypothetical protein C7413_11453 [Paraburkholderia silvatlantica]PYE22093.1 hypothetical protein C7410_11126 [Paraburkholderia silvatlantica]TDQ98997.1 hypothetical protein C7412_104214 [Paraburkholderia silvatlantica]
MQAIPKSPRRGVAARVMNAMGVAALVAAAGGCAAQTQPEPPVAPAPPPVATGAMPPGIAPVVPLAPPPGIAPMAPLAPPPGGPLPLADAGPAVTAQGTVSRFLINPDGDVDGFLTGDGQVVHFPPHMGPQLTSMVRPGDNVQVSGWRDAGGNIAAQRIVDARSGRQLEDQPPVPGSQPLPPALRGAALSRLSVQGRVAHVTTAPRGEPDGVILADGTVIKLTPPIAQQFPALLQTGAQVSAQGYGTRNPYGTALQATAFGPPGNLTRLYDSLPPAP